MPYADIGEEDLLMFFQDFGLLLCSWELRWQNLIGPLGKQLQDGGQMLQESNHQSWV